MVPFWRYYGGKYRSAPLYPRPVHGTVIEPFAGAAGYSLRYSDLDVILIEKYPVIAEVWRYLIGASAAEIRRIPETEDVRELPASLSQGAKWLVGFCMNSAAATPRITLSAGAKRLRAAGRHFEGWCEASRERIAAQVDRIGHWKVIEGDYSCAPDVEATWFIDPPYQTMGRHYALPLRGAAEYARLAAWSRDRRGQVMVCEGEGAAWLPFAPLATVMGMRSKRSVEMLWTNADQARTEEA